MCRNQLMKMPSQINPRNLGFYISPDITIEYVRPEADSSPAESPTPPPLKELSNDEDDDLYFNPLAFCAVKMDYDTELQQDTMDSLVRIKRSLKVTKKSKSLANRTKENSLFVYNGTSHPADKPKKCHACHLCPKTFGWTTDLKRHLLIHTGERPFKCTLCNATFTRNFLLQKHKSKIHQCLSPLDVSQLNNNVAKNLIEIKQKMRELESAKIMVPTDEEAEEEAC